jgi:deoxyribodipyrimidine photolyase-like uncharacterized protein
LEDFYRHSRQQLQLLMDGDQPAGGAWNFDHDNRQPPPKTGLKVAAPWWPIEDDIDADVRRDLDRWEVDGDVGFIGADGPRRFAATHDEPRDRMSDYRGPCRYNPRHRTGEDACPFTTGYWPSPSPSPRPVRRQPADGPVRPRA